jgi:hypothetical protein
MIHLTGRQRRSRRARPAVTGGTTRLTATQESSASDAQRNHRAGIIRPNTGMLRLPADLAEPAERPLSARPGPVVAVIIGLALAFIALITWFVAHERPSENQGRPQTETGSEQRK